MIFDRNMILPIKHMVGWEILRQLKQKNIYRDITRKNKHIFDYDYKLGYNIMLTKTLHTYMRQHIKAFL